MPVPDAEYVRVETLLYSDKGKKLVDKIVELRHLWGQLALPEDMQVMGISINAEQVYLKGKRVEQNRIRAVLGL